MERLPDASFRDFEVFMTVMLAFVLGGIMGAALATGAGMMVAIWVTVLAAIAVTVGVLATELLVDAPQEIPRTRN